MPSAYLIHLLEEYFGGVGFPHWFSNLLNISLTPENFILINAFGFSATLIITILYNLDKANDFIIAVLGTLFFVNGIVHLLATLFSATYSPGTITGVIIYIPLGILIFKMIFPRIKKEQRMLCFVTAIVVQIIVALIAYNI